MVPIQKFPAKLAAAVAIFIVISRTCLTYGFVYPRNRSPSFAVAGRPVIHTSYTAICDKKLILSCSERRLSSIINSYDKNSATDGFREDDPDLLGVQIDGFPIPATPCFENDQELLASIRQVPVTSIVDPVSPQRRITKDQPLRVLIAGGGLGGLALASCLTRKGMDVHVLERASQYRPFGGPIQIQSNALWALQQINPVLYDAVREVGVQTGDRLSGIKDGIRSQSKGESWLVKFDAATPARAKNLPLTLAINRVVLQDIFLKYGVAPERVHTGSSVMSYQNLEHGGVAVNLQNGTLVYGDLLVGADGIWSSVRHQMYGLPSNELGPKYATRHAKYSGYTCYTGTCKHIPDDIQQVAYKVFLGQQQYLGSTDCGQGWQHWWAFLPDPPGSQHERSGQEMLDRLKHEFQGWNADILDLFEATNASQVQRRDLFDRPPLTKGWIDENVALLGDAAHPTMPNLGQGGAMAMEDAFVLGQELDGIQHTNEVPQRLIAYEKRRYLRASIAQFLSRNGSDLLVDWEHLRQTPIVGDVAMACINWFQPISMNYLYSSNI